MLNIRKKTPHTKFSPLSGNLNPILVLLFIGLCPFISMAQAPVDISYEVVGSVSANELSQLETTAAPKECTINFHFSAPQVRVIMESTDGQTNYVDRTFALNVHTNTDSTWVAGKPGAWTIGLGHFENVSAFRVRLVNANAQGGNGNGQGNIPVVAQGTYP